MDHLFSHYLGSTHATAQYGFRNNKVESSFRIIKNPLAQHSLDHRLIDVTATLRVGPLKNRFGVFRNLEKTWDHGSLKGSDNFAPLFKFTYRVLHSCQAAVG